MAKDHSEVLTVVFTDIVGYTRTTAQLSREEFSQLHDIFDQISLPLFQTYEGTVIKKIGDAFLITFKSPTQAVLCGVALQKAFREHNKTSKRPIRIRVAIHTGEVIVRKDDVYGEAVNTASRIEDIATPGHVVFSEAVFGAMNKREVAYMHLGMKHLKGMKYPIRLFRVKTAYDDYIRAVNRVKTIVTTLLVLGLVASLVYLVVQYIILQPGFLG
ncbi:adenylate/guanylate cyclase domain-containing protein [Candidatus Woesearchaeota archaeon]|nr:adenylate/guanylate cyclase domain-containing protein [Candidatus Woesearchaeota archaeon]